MSEPIQSISQGNYLLSNLNAQKLYAQSPLTTGVSGTSAYIGIEPSAQYNETVLWEGSLTSASNTDNYLSEPLSSFELFRIHIRPIEQSVGMMEQTQDFKCTSTAERWCYVDGRFIAANQRTQNTLYFEFGNNLQSFHLRNGWKMVGVTQTTGVSNYDFSVDKIVGINRKENA